MSFQPKDWRNYPDTSTPITAEALEEMETRLAVAIASPGKSVAITPSNAGTTSGTADTSATIITADSTRASFSLTNKHATATIWISYGGTAVVGEGIPVNAGMTWTEDSYKGIITGISFVASVPYAYTVV